MPRTRAEIEAQIATAQRSIETIRDSNPVNYAAMASQLQFLQNELASLPRTAVEVALELRAAKAEMQSDTPHVVHAFERVKKLQRELDQLTTPDDFKCEPPKPTGQPPQELTWKYPKIPFDKVDAARKKSMASFAAFEAAQKEVFMTTVEQLCDECFDNGKTKEDIVAALEALALKKL
jgi:hypothetical protein